MTRVLIVGGAGLLGVNWAYHRRDIDDVHITTHRRNIKIDDVVSHQLDARNIRAVQHLLKEIKPDLMVNCSGLTNIDLCEKQPDLSFECNVKIADYLSKSAAFYNTPFIHISTDHLFGGATQKATEATKPNPQNIYAKHKLEAENVVQKNYQDALVVRTTFFGWGPAYRKSFSDGVLEDLRNNRQVQMFDDVLFTPLHTNQIVDLAHQLVDKSQSGIINLCSSDRVSKYEFSVALAKVFGLDAESIQPIQASRQRKTVKRPLNLSLDNSMLKDVLNIDGNTTVEAIKLLYDAEISGRSIQKLGHFIPYGRHFLDDSDITAVANTLKSGALTQGPAIPQFEQRIAEYTGARYAVAVSSATAGLHLAYLALGIESGKSVLTTPNTFVSTANAAHFCGGHARFADIDPRTANMALETTKLALEQHDDIYVVAPVLFGGAADGIPKIAKLAKSKGKFVVEDAAHGLGGEYACGAKIGSCQYSDCTVFSLHPVKSIAAGEGGIITTNDDAIYTTLLRLRSHGINKNDDPFQNIEDAYTDGEPNLWYYEMSSLGFHYRLTDIQASLANSQLDKLDNFIARRRELAHRYVTWLHQQEYVQRAQSVDIESSANHLFVVAIDFDRLKISRQNVMKQLRCKNIITQVHYIPVVNHPYFKDQGINPQDFPVSQDYYQTALSLPLYYSLSDNEFDHILGTIDQILQA